MSYIGKNPKVKTIGLTALSADPTNPVDGDVFNSDGTSRNAGLWVRKAGAWSRIGRLYTREMTVNGPYSTLGAQDNVLFLKLPTSLTAATLIEAKLTVFFAGTAGSTEVDVRLKRGAGALTTIFSTKPIVAFGAGDFASNAGTLSTTAFQGDDILQLDIKQVQTGGVGFYLQLTFNE